MYKMRRWSARHAGTLNNLYERFEQVLVKLYPRIKKLGLEKVEKPLFFFERNIKEFLFDSQSCGQCTLGSTGMSCPMNCPKTIRNGPCGGVRPNGKCEVKPEMDCVWVVAWDGTQHMKQEEQAIQMVQKPLDNRLQGRSAWLRAAEQKLQELRR